MQPETSIRNADAKVIALLVVLFAGLVGVIGLAINDPSVDTPNVEPVKTAHLSLLSDTPQAVDAKAPVRTAKITPEENWAADESSHGLRSDAAH